jgi:hypothetical protein
MENFSIAEIETGTPLGWSRVETVLEGFPVGLVREDGWVHLFATDVQSFTALDRGGLVAWRSEDGLVWERLGQVIDRSQQITQVRATPQGLVAFGSDQDNRNVVVWRSNDAISWAPEPIAIEEATEAITFYAQAVGGSEHVLLVSASTQFDVSRLVEEGLGDLMGDRIDLSRYGWSTDLVEDEYVFQLWGPVGFPLFETTATELDLSEAERDALDDSYRGGNESNRVWASTDGGEWQSVDLPDAVWVDSIFADTSDGIVVVGSGNQGPKTWTSSDGLNWEEAPSSRRPYGAERWNDRLVGPAMNGGGKFLVSDDGRDWVELGPDDTFPISIQWTIQAMGAGPGGLLAGVAGWRSDISTTQSEPSIITMGDATLSIDFTEGRFTVEKDGATHTWTTYTSTTPDGMSFDLPTQRITFSDTDTGEELATIGLEEIAEAEVEYWTTQPSDQYWALLFSADGEEWTVQDTSSAFGADNFLIHLQVTETTAIAAVVSSERRFFPDASTGFEIWAAPLP